MRLHFIQNFKKTYIILLRLSFLYLVIFEILRVLFVITQFDKIKSTTAPISEVLYAFISSFLLDISSISYLLVISFCFLLFLNIFKTKILLFIFRIYLYFTGAMIILIGLIELGIYGEWAIKPTSKIFTYLDHPSEIFNSAPLLQSIYLISLFFILITIFIIYINKILSNDIIKLKKSYLFTFVYFIITPILLLLGIRGGINSIPISQSDPYYSKYEILNDLATNTSYIFLHSIIKDKAISSNTNPYKTKTPIAIKQQYIKQYLNTNCKGEKILTTTRPNIMLVILESASGVFISDDKKYNKITPTLNKLASNGILFKNTIGSGLLSQEGIVAILSGQPAIDDIYVTNLKSKYNPLPTITQTLAKNHYSSLYLFGGELRYGNMKAFVYKNGYDTIYENKDIDKLNLKQEGQLGYHDKNMFELLSKITDKSKEPFFNTFFTLSSHSPYDQPMRDEILFGGYHSKYLNSIRYTDKSIDLFMKSAKTKPWYKNTLFVFVSDHSHITPHNYSRNSSSWHKIVMLFYGEVLKNKFKGVVVNKIVSQHDLASTLLSQLNIDNSSFIYSRDIFCKDYKQGSYFEAIHGYGFISNNGAYSKNVKENIIYENSLKDTNSSIPKIGRYYLENLFDEILKR